MTHSRVGFGRIVERQALVSAFARAHFSSASVEGNVPRAIVLPAHYFRFNHEEKSEKKLWGMHGIMRMGISRQ